MEIKRDFFLNIQGQDLLMMLKAFLLSCMDCLDRFLTRRISMKPSQRLSVNTQRNVILTCPSTIILVPMTDTMMVLLQSFNVPSTSVVERLDHVRISDPGVFVAN